MGVDPSGADSIAKQIAPASHWPEMRILVLVVNDSRKKTSSAIGMKRSAETSELLKHRAKNIVPKRVKEMQEAILTKNFEKFAELTMKDSNQMHAVAMDTYPPCFYLNDVSHTLIDLIHSYNDAVGSTKVAYTNDAGPNTVLYLLEENVPEILGVLNHFVPSALSSDDEYLRGEPISGVTASKNLIERMNFPVQTSGLLKYIIYTRVGDGPKCLKDPKRHLLDSRGLPIDP